MRRAIQSLVSRQSVLARAQPPSMIYPTNSYVCVNCRRYLLGRLLPREEKGGAAVGGRGGGVKRVPQQQQRGIHVTAKNLRSRGVCPNDAEGVQGPKKDQDGIPVQKPEDKSGGGRFVGSGRVPLRKVLLTVEQQRLINQRTGSFSQLRNESDVGSPDSLGTKLVDIRPFTQSTRLWRTLLDFKRRLYQDAGVKDIWNGMQLRKIDLPVGGSGSDLIWGIFLESALRDKAFLEDIWKYIQDFDSRLGRTNNWPGIYDTIVGHFLINDPPKARLWHYRLYPRHVSRSWSELFTTIIQQRSDLQIQLREIHATIRKPAGVYTAMVQTLCAMGLHDEALRWHRHLISFDDKPEDTSAANELIKWMAKYGSVAELQQLMRSFVETGIKVAESSLIDIINMRPDKFEALRFVLARSSEMDKAAMGDDFWALVVSQASVERGTIYRYLETFGTGLVVGPKTVEAVIKRFELPEDKSIWILAEIGMTFQKPASITDSEEPPTSPSSGPEPKPKTEPWGPEVTTRPRTMDALHSSLRAFFKGQDWSKFDLALRFNSPAVPDVKLHNILLQSDLYRGKLSEALHRVEHMRTSSIAISTPSLRLLVTRILSPRRRGHNPVTRPSYLEDDLFLVIGLLFSLLRSGSTEVDPTIWREVFKRLGMTRRLSDIEALACGLVEWYHPTRSVSTRRRLARTPTIPSTADSPMAAGLGDPEPPLSTLPSHPAKIPHRSRTNPLRKLFPKNFIMAIVEWGFMTFRPYSPEIMPLIPRPPPSLEVRPLPEEYVEFAACAPRLTWGIMLARKLQRLGVFVEPAVVVRAVRVRLDPIFNKSEDLMTHKKINRLAVALNYLTLEETVGIVEEAWGGELYKRQGWEKRETKGGGVVGGATGGSSEEKEMEVEWERQAAMKREVLGVGIPEVRMLRRERISGEWRKRKMKKKRWYRRMR